MDVVVARESAMRQCVCIITELAEEEEEEALFDVWGKGCC
jgi:hypothetical protein